MERESSSPSPASPPAGRMAEFSAGAQGEPVEFSADDRHAMKDLLKALPQYVKEISAYFNYWFSAQRDRVQVKIRKIAVGIALGIIGGIAAVAIVCISVYLVLASLSAGLAQLFGDIGPGYAWLGPLIIGVAALTVIALGVFIGLARMTRTTKRQMEKKYEGKRNDQHGRFGQDVERRAQQSREHGGASTHAV